MKLQRFLSILLCAVMLLSVAMTCTLPSFAEDSEPGYVTEGLVSHYKGVGNASDATVWKDSVGSNDLPINKNATNYFTEDGLVAQGTQHYFPQAIVDLVNGKAFTVEIAFGDFESIGGSFNTFMNSANDNFAWFRRNNNDNLEFKWAGKPGDVRPKAANGLDLIDNGTVAITFEVGGLCCMYVDGALVAKVSADTSMGANNLFIGHAESSKQFSTIYRSIRFYDRALTAEEIQNNALVDGAKAPTAPVEKPVINVTVAQPATNIVGDISMIRQVNSKAEMDAMLGGASLPALAMYTVNQKLEAVDDAGAAFTTVEGIFKAHEYRVIAAFRVEDKAAANALAAYLNEIRFYDCMVVSSDPALMQELRTALPAVTGAIDYTATYRDVTALTEEQCLEIRRSIKIHNGTVAILPLAVCSNDTVQYLYNRQVNVWAMSPDQPTAREQYSALLSGAIGVISDATDALLEIACNQLPENTMTRVPLNIGHRGLPSKAPENTIEGALEAYEQGASVIELDVYLTKDNQLVIMHDGTTGRTCNADISVEGSTLAELKELYVNKGFEKKAQYAECRVPTLEEFLQAFKDKDCQLFIEIKSSKTAIVPAIKACIDALDMYDQCSVITFNEGIMAAMRKDYPEMSVGALCSGYMAGADPETDLRTAMSFIGKYNATLNPSYTGYEQNDLRAALMRGISIYPWTFRGSLSTYADHYLWGYSGLTGDNANVFKTQACDASTVIGDDYAITLELQKYGRATETVNPTTVIVLEGNDMITEQNGQYVVTGEGTAVLIPGVQVKLGSKGTYVLFGEICEVTLATETTEQNTAAPETLPDAEATEDVTEEIEQGKSGCKALMSGAALLLALAAGIVLTVEKKNRA